VKCYEIAIELYGKYAYGGMMLVNIGRVIVVMVMRFVWVIWWEMEYGNHATGF